MSTLRRPEVAALLFRHLALAQRGGLPLAKALEPNVMDPSWFDGELLPLGRLAESVRSKSRLSAAVRDLPDMFTPELAELLQKAEDRGKLADVLDALARDYGLVQEIRATVRATTQWPRYLAVMFTVLAVAVMVFLIPAYKDLFTSFGADLPPMTQVLLGLSTLLRTYGLWLLIPIILLGWLAWKDRLPVGLFKAIERLGLQFPGRKANREHTFAAQLAIWLRVCHGEPELLKAAMARLKVETRSHLFSASAATLEARLSTGQDAPRALDNLEGAPRYLATQIRLAGEMSDPAPTLDHLCEVTAERARRSLLGFANRLTLASYLVIGWLLGYLVIAIYLPIFKLGSAI